MEQSLISWISVGWLSWHSDLSSPNRKDRSYPCRRAKRHNCEVYIVLIDCFKADPEGKTDSDSQ